VGDSLLTPFFAGLGIKELSMAPGLLPKVREKLLKLDMALIEQENLVERILEAATIAEVINVLQTTSQSLIK
jgi:phosphotransferase system enzyme I (PtsI)